MRDLRTLIESELFGDDRTILFQDGDKIVAQSPFMTIAILITGIVNNEKLNTAEEYKVNSFRGSTHYKVEIDGDKWDLVDVFMLLANNGIEVKVEDKDR